MYFYSSFIVAISVAVLVSSHMTYPSKKNRLNLAAAHRIASLMIKSDQLMSNHIN